MSKEILEFKQKRLIELRILMVEALNLTLKKQCDCISCKGLVVLAKHINTDNPRTTKESECSS